MSWKSYSQSGSSRLPAVSTEGHVNLRNKGEGDSVAIHFSGFPSPMAQPLTLEFQASAQALMHEEIQGLSESLSKGPGSNIISLVKYTSSLCCNSSTLLL